MSYADVISLKQTLNRLLHSSHIIINSSSTKKILESALTHVISLQQILERSHACCSRDEKIRDLVQKLEDLLEFHESNHFLAQFESIKTKKGKRKSAGYEEIRQGIESFCETAERIAKDCAAEIGDDEEDDNDEAVASDLTLLADPNDHTEIEEYLTERMRPNDFGVFQICGPPGSGASIAAATIFHDLNHRFDCRAWVSLGGKVKLECREFLLVSILAQISHEPIESINSEGYERIGEHLYSILKNRRYLIVLDSIRCVEIWDFLESFFPVEDNGSAVLLTTGATTSLQIHDSFMCYHMDSLDQDCWWYLFRAGVFGWEPCPLELEEAGKKIVENCTSLSIPVVKVILLLLKVEKDVEIWKELAQDKQNSIYTVHDEFFEVSKIKEEICGANNYSFIDEDRADHLLDLIDFSDKIESIKMEMFPKRFFSKMLTVSLFGMAGIGKTTLVKKIFEKKSILRHFQHHIWVTLGPKYHSEEILVDILGQIYPDIDKKLIKGDKDLVQSLCAQILDTKCLIVLDDVWSKKPLNYIKNLLPNIKGVTMVTTRLGKVAQIGKGDIFFKMRLLTNEESWNLFCETVFVEERCPLQLEKAGKKIAENCEGLPLMIVTVARLLSDMERTPECWNDVVQINSPIFMAAYDQISKILIPSYDYLPQYLKVCFLYLGIFPQNYKVIMTSKLIKLWIAEGFLEPSRSQTPEDFAAECLLDLENRSLLMSKEKGSDFRIKTCSLHSVFWHLSNHIAMKNKFFHAFTTFSDCRIEDMEYQRRLCIRNCTLLGLKDVHDLISSISTARSLLCAGPSHHYPVPVYFDLRFLRLLDALAIRLYEFPIEVVKSHCLRYLALTYYGDLPSAVSELWNLQFLIVSRHLKIKSPTASSYLPMEIWNMRELKHLQVAGSDVPDPNHGDALPNLLSLLDVSAQSCRKKVLKSVPNLKRLRIQIEVEPDEKGNPFRCLNRIGRLRGLESLTCVVVNPDFMSEIVAPPVPRSMFPSSLKKLSLSGLGYPWEFMKIISKLENLEVLKLRCYAFQGPEWEVDDNGFEALGFLLIEDTDLVRWKFTTACLVHVKCISIKHCYQLEELPCDLSNTVQTVEVVECNPFVENWAKELEEDVNSLHAISSWDARN